VPIVGCGGVAAGRDVVEYLLAGARAVAMGTVLMEDPRAGTRILAETERELERLGVTRAADLTGSVRRWWPRSWSRSTFLRSRGLWTWLAGSSLTWEVSRWGWSCSCRKAPGPWPK